MQDERQITLRKADTMADIELRAYVFMDSLQPQLTSQIGSTARGFLPIVGDASLFVEIAPGIAINSLLDVALKATNVRPAEQVVERAFGTMEIHSEDKGQVMLGGEAILRTLNLRETDRLKPRIVSAQVLRNITDYQTQIINRTAKSGTMILPGQSLFILEVHPAAYSVYAANEAEKAAGITLIDVRAFGAFGRLYLCGSEREVDYGSQAATKSLELLEGRANTPGKG